MEVSREARPEPAKERIDAYALLHRQVPMDEIVAKHCSIAGRGKLAGIGAPILSFVRGWRGTRLPSCFHLR